MESRTCLFSLLSACGSVVLSVFTTQIRGYPPSTEICLHTRLPSAQVTVTSCSILLQPQAPTPLFSLSLSLSLSVSLSFSFCLSLYGWLSL